MVCSCRKPRALSGQCVEEQYIELPSPSSIGVVPHQPMATCLADPAGRLDVETAQDIRDVTAIAGDENFLAGREKLLDAGPGIADDAGAGASRLEDARRRGVARPRHALTVDVQNRKRRRVEGIVGSGRYMSDPSHVRRERLVVPP